MEKLFPDPFLNTKKYVGRQSEVLYSLFLLYAKLSDIETY